MNKTALSQIIDILIEKYPNRLPVMVIPETEIARMIGQQDVIHHLAQLLEAEDRKKNG